MLRQNTQNGGSLYDRRIVKRECNRIVRRVHSLNQPSK